MTEIAFKKRSKQDFLLGRTKQHDSQYDSLFEQADGEPYEIPVPEGRTPEQVASAVRTRMSSWNKTRRALLNGSHHQVHSESSILDGKLLMRFYVRGDGS